ncbi:hypothetical protein COCSUDRAFT_57542 [Coccomyxa subellipsoidea C-169]|uniref:LysM domain-containing protein n=1 Tax=Coccomyxa subellipsoidea (strain C-169) TaxID=574566 RepID=I0YPS5_COCSC|nr:hypothetical protein COCSUDRAFT_57542 [Coccomyxa subellipsoidea C-169]EIE20394.1 hypothetical protein COCSUDRAFT_57542 [Coccomyxa subellipsoidea C-169]|eukprot:XP_005644938.1 hypothetical protein COCSUDRAFT_57542 [Coccomyxa subellipsoidea C-169]
MRACTVAAFIALLASPAVCQNGAPAPSLATAAQQLKAQAPATANAISAALTGPSAACLIPAHGGTLLNAPIMAGNPTATAVRPVALGTAAFGYALHVQEGAPDQILPEVGDLPEGTELAEIGELGAIALSTAQVDSASLDDLQDGNVAAADSSFNQVQGTALADPTKALNAALTGGRLLSALPPGTDVTTLQNSAVLAPRPQPVAASPTALPASFAAGVAASKALAGRKMMEAAHSAPPCCDTYTVLQGDTLDSIAAKFGQPKNGPAIIRAINGLSSTGVTPGQVLMLPCGRVLSYITSFNAAAALRKTASQAPSAG